VLVFLLKPKMLEEEEDEDPAATYKYLPDGSMSTELEVAPEFEIKIGMPWTAVNPPPESIENPQRFEEFALTTYRNWPSGSIAIASTPVSTIIGEVASGVKVPVVAFIEKAEMLPESVFAT
jgi:hypothetical protein